MGHDQPQIIMLTKGGEMHSLIKSWRKFIRFDCTLKSKYFTASDGKTKTIKLALNFKGN